MKYVTVMGDVSKQALAAKGQTFPQVGHAERTLFEQTHLRSLVLFYAYDGYSQLIISPYQIKGAKLISYKRFKKAV